ncbi:MAG: 16S rRNA (guanine(966)-N(2))-methyltransferase RsmD [Gordonia sp. (in: high G+C Gram-positive bacteria)]
MTRIIAGEFGGRRLKVPDEGTRPTSDRVREALFSALSARIDFSGLRVLDLYAGSGALGIEALSRGAASATFVDNRKRATAVITSNLRDLGVAGRAVVITRGAGVVLQTPPAPAGVMDLVFTDPPYALGAEEVDADLVSLTAGWLAPEALVVAERSARTPDIGWPAAFEVVVARTYGDTHVEVGRFTP